MKSKFGQGIYESWIKKIEFVNEFNNFVLISVSNLGNIFSNTALLKYAFSFLSSASCSIPLSSPKIFNSSTPLNCEKKRSAPRYPLPFRINFLAFRHSPLHSRHTVTTDLSRSWLKSLISRFSKVNAKSKGGTLWLHWLKVPVHKPDYKVLDADRLGIFSKNPAKVVTRHVLKHDNLPAIEFWHDFLAENIFFWTFQRILEVNLKKILQFFIFDFSEKNLEISKL